MLNYGLPLSAYSILTGILAQVYLFMVAPLTSNAVYGSFQTAMNFSVLLTFFSVPISTVLFPAFAKLDPQNEDDLLRTVFSSSVKYSSILLVPATMALMALSGPIIGTLYGVKYVYGPFFLTLYVITNLFVVIGNLSSTGFLSGLGETRILMFQSVVTIIVGFPLGLILIPLLGITGLLVASILAMIPSMGWVLYWIWKRYGARADFRSSAKISIASAVAAAVAYLPAGYLNAANWIRLLVGLFIFLAVYVLGAPLMGAVSLADLDTLRNMFSGLGFISRILDVPLSAAEKTARMRPWKRE
jgi:O-antigen/teichoic acid export membrane protein